MDIEQGNVYNQDMVARLHPGMTREQVNQVMGGAVLLNTFNDNRTVYVYTFKPGGGQMYEKYVILTFRGNILKDIQCR